MSYQRIQLTEDVSRPWAIAQSAPAKPIACILPDSRQYIVARFYNRQDAEDYKRVLHRFLPASKFEIVFDLPIIDSDQ